MKNIYLEQAAEEIWAKNNIIIPGNENVGDLFRSLTGTLLKPFEGTSVAGYIKGVIASKPRTESDRGLDKKIMETEYDKLKDIVLRKPPMMREHFLRYASVVNELLIEVKDQDTKAMKPMAEWMDSVCARHNAETVPLTKYPNITLINMDKSLGKFRSLYTKMSGKATTMDEQGRFELLFPTNKHFVEAGKEMAILQETVDSIDPERFFSLEDRIKSATKYYTDNLSEIKLSKKELQQTADDLRQLGQELEFLSVLLTEAKRASVLFNEYVAQLKKELK